MPWALALVGIPASSGTRGQIGSHSLENDPYYRNIEASFVPTREVARAPAGQLGTQPVYWGKRNKSSSWMNVAGANYPTAWRTFWLKRVEILNINLIRKKYRTS